MSKQMHHVMLPGEGEWREVVDQQVRSALPKLPIVLENKTLTTGDTYGEAVASTSRLLSQAAFEFRSGDVYSVPEGYTMRIVCFKNNVVQAFVNWAGTHTLTSEQAASYDELRLQIAKKVTDSYQPSSADITTTEVQPTIPSDFWTGLDEVATKTLVDELGGRLEDTEDDISALEETADAIEADIGDLWGTLGSFPIRKNSEEEGPDLDISDPSGNVLARFEDGHFATKCFDSKKQMNVVGSLTTGPDLDVSDESGNVIMRLSGGGIETKNFNSAMLKNISEVYTNSDTVSTITVDVSLKKGDKIVIATDDGIGNWRWGNYVTYKEGSKTIANNIQGSNMLFEHIVTADCSTISVVFGDTPYGHSATRTLTVYKLGLLPIVPTIVTVRTDGTGDFTTIRDAIDYVNAQNPSAELNPFEIHVGPGTYDVMDDYSEEEIRDGNTDDAGYSNTSFVGPKLEHGVSLVGDGLRDDIIISGYLDPETYESSVRRNISTLNMHGSGNLMNLTIVSDQIRYCVHDDFTSPYARTDYRKVINCKFIGTNFPNNADSTYGAGMVAPRFMYFKDCDFGRNCGVHTVYNSRGMRIGVQVTFENCRGLGLRIGDRVHTENDPFNTFLLNNCDFEQISIARGDGDVEAQHCRVVGTGCENTMFFGKSMDKYALGMVKKVAPGITQGKAVSIGNTVVTSPAAAYGVCIGSDDDFSYIQFAGYINSKILGIVSPSVGDYITVDSGGSVVSGGTAENAIGKCVYVNSSSVGQYKLAVGG